MKLALSIKNWTISSILGIYIDILVGAMWQQNVFVNSKAADRSGCGWRPQGRQLSHCIPDHSLNAAGTSSL